MVVIVDYGMGNLRSVEKAAEQLGARVRISRSPATIKKAKKIVFPGVGHFARAVRELRRRKIFDLLKERIDSGTPFLGICLGMQLLLERSQEAPGVRGLGVIKGSVRRFKAGSLIVPHMGWNQVRPRGSDGRCQGKGIFKGVAEGSYFYFAHSYYCRPQKPEVVAATTDYGLEFASALNKGNVWGCQFHPEKSQRLGLKVFNNFLKI